MNGLKDIGVQATFCVCVGGREGRKYRYCYCNCMVVYRECTGLRRFKMFLCLQIFGVYVAYKYRNQKDPRGLSGSFL